MFNIRAANQVKMKKSFKIVKRKLKKVLMKIKLIFKKN